MNKEHVLIFTEGIKRPDDRLPMLDSLRWEHKALPIVMSYNFDNGAVGTATNIVREGPEIFADLSIDGDYDLEMFLVDIYATQLVFKNDPLVHIQYITDMVLRAVALIPMPNFPKFNKVTDG